MSSTYSPSLRIQLIDTGTELEAWGTPTDNNFGTIIEQAITGVNSISLTNLTSLTLSTANAAVDQARNAVLVFTGTPSANCNVVAPSVNKVYIVSNETTGGFNVNMKTSGGDILSIPPSSKQLIFCNGTAFTTVVNPNIVNGNLTVTGSANIGGNITVGGNVLLASTVTNQSGNLALNSFSNIVSFQQNTGALRIPSGTTPQRPTNLALGMQRWNTDLGLVEVWNGSSWIVITGTTAINYLIVAGGGGGGVNSGNPIGSGGGGGGVISGSYATVVGTSYPVVVGSGGTGGVSGSNSSAFGQIAIGGGAGGNSVAKYDGGSGGGSGGFGAGLGTSGQGYAGGPSAGGTSGQTFGGGGGGAGSAGLGAVYNTRGGDGGAGIQSSINGTATYYAGGYAGCWAGIGGTGGTPGAGVLNAGGGGDSYTAGSGQNGVVIISYANATQKGTGGTVTSYTSGGATYWVHTFTSSGSFVTS